MNVRLKVFFSCHEFTKKDISHIHEVSLLPPLDILSSFSCKNYKEESAF